MTTKVERLENSRVKLETQVDAAEFEKGMQAAYRKVVKKVNIPGFRKGKVPRPILERQYGKEIFYEDAVDFLLPTAYEKAVKEAEIRPVDQPDVDIDEIDPEKGVSFKFEVDVYPEIELGEYTGLAVTKEVETISDEDVAKALGELQERHSELVVVDSRDQVQEGDFAIIDFKGYLDGEPFPGGAGEDHSLEIGSGQFIPGFEEQLVGMKVGEEREISVTFPEDYQSADLAGKKTTFKVKIKELKEKILPELDDDFAKDVSEEASLDELKAKIRTDLEDAATRRTNSKLENTLIEKVIEGSEFELPNSMIASQTDHLLQEMSQNLMYQGINLDQYLEITKQNKEELKESLRPEAISQLQKDLVIDAIADKEGIKAEEDEITTKIDEFVEKSSQPEKTREFWEQRRANLGVNLRVEKTYQFLVDNATITETDAE